MYMRAVAAADDVRTTAAVTHLAFRNFFVDGGTLHRPMRTHADESL